MPTGVLVGVPLTGRYVHVLMGTGAQQGCWCPCPADAQRDDLPHDCPAAEAEGRAGMRPSLPAPVSHCAGDNSQGRGFALPAPGVPGHPGV